MELYEVEATMVDNQTFFLAKTFRSYTQATISLRETIKQSDCVLTRRGVYINAGLIVSFRCLKIETEVSVAE